MKEVDEVRQQRSAKESQMNLTLKPDMYKKHETKQDFQKKTVTVK